MNGTSKKEKILVYLKANPNKSTIQVAKALGVRKEYVYNIKSAEGMTKPKSINGAMKKAITSALVDTKPAAKDKIVHKHIDSATVSVKIQLEMSSQRYFTMSIQEAQELYSTLKPLMER